MYLLEIICNSNHFLIVYFFIFGERTSGRSTSSSCISLGMCPTNSSLGMCPTNSVQFFSFYLSASMFVKSLAWHALAESHEKSEASSIKFPK